MRTRGAHRAGSGRPRVDTIRVLIAVRDERLAGDVHLGGDVHGAADGGGPVVVVARARLAARVRVLREEVHPGAWTRYSPLCAEPSESLAQGDRARAREMRCGALLFSRSAPRGWERRAPHSWLFTSAQPRASNNFRHSQRDSARGGFPIRLSTRDRKRRRATRATITSRNASHGRGRCARGEVSRYSQRSIGRVSRLGGSKSGVESGTDKGPRTLRLLHPVEGRQHPPRPVGARSHERTSGERPQSIGSIGSRAVSDRTVRLTR